VRAWGMMVLVLWACVGGIGNGTPAVAGQSEDAGLTGMGASLGEVAKELTPQPAPDPGPGEAGEQPQQDYERTRAALLAGLFHPIQVDGVTLYVKDPVEDEYALRFIRDYGRVGFWGGTKYAKTSIERNGKRFKDTVPQGHASWPYFQQGFLLASRADTYGMLLAGTSLRRDTGELVSFLSSPDRLVFKDGHQEQIRQTCEGHPLNLPPSDTQVWECERRYTLSFSSNPTKRVVVQRVHLLPIATDMGAGGTTSIDDLITYLGVPDYDSGIATAQLPVDLWTVDLPKYPSSSLPKVRTTASGKLLMWGKYPGLEILLDAGVALGSWISKPRALWDLDYRYRTGKAK